MSHARPERRRPTNSVARCPGSAYGALLVRIVGAVVLTAIVSWSLPPTAGLSCPPYVTCDLSGTFWGVDMIDSSLVEAVAAFSVSRITSPLVFGPLAVAGVVALVAEYRRGRFDSVLERRS